MLNNVNSDQVGQQDGFLTLDHVSQLDIATKNVEAAQKDLARLRRPPDAVEVVAGAEGRTEIRVRYNAGTPVWVFEKIVARLEVIESRYAQRYMPVSWDGGAV